MELTQQDGDTSFMVMHLTNLPFNEEEVKQSTADITSESDVLFS